MNKPALYTTANRPQRRDVRDFSEEFIDEIGEMSGKCLDIGSGPGDTVVDLILPKMNKKTSLVCSDISENMVNFGKEKYKDMEQLSFIKLNIESRDLSKNLMEKFDHVTSFYCLHWCQDMRQVFENIYDLLQPGGTAFLTFLANIPSAIAYKTLSMMPRYQPYMKDADRYIPVFQNSEQPQKTLKALCKDVGFEVRHCSVRERTYTFDNPELLRKTTLAINPFFERIPAHLKADYEKDLVKEVARHWIIFNKNNNDERDYSILGMYHTFIVYLKKPSSKLYSN